MHLFVVLLNVASLSAALSIAAAACVLCAVLFRREPMALLASAGGASAVVIGPAAWNLWRVLHGATGVLTWLLPAGYLGLTLPLCGLLLTAASAAARP